MHAGDHPTAAQHPAAAPDYSRQTALKEVGTAGQAKLRSSSVLVVGCGGLGVPVIGYLAGAGIGRLGLVDADRLEASNLHRQTMYALADVGAEKAQLAAARVRALNPEVDVQAHVARLDIDSAPALLEPYDLIIDCTDNFATKFLLNDLAVRAGKTVIFSSVYQYEGQLQVVRPGGACLRCLWPEATRDGIVGNCAEAGVLGPVPGTFGSLQALEALKLLLNLPGRIEDELVVIDLLNLSVTRVRTQRAADCPQHALTLDARTATGGGASAPLEVAYESLEQAVAAGYELVDIREPHEVAATPVPGARVKLIPMAQLLYGTPAYTPTGKSLLICASGRRTLAATQELRTRGYANVFSLKGGVAGLLAGASGSVRRG
jgi:adenylyltransferase/sulfurtransferase